MTSFEKDVHEGLNLSPKYLSSKYFYDKIGDELFVQIMNMPEYYLFNAEFEIFQKQQEQMIQALSIQKDTYFELIELGAGDGTKTKELLKALDKRDFSFDYLPIDISQSSLDKLDTALKNEMPNVTVKTKQGDYFEVLASLKDSHHPKVVLFLGSNIGNLLDRQAHDFIYQLGGSLRSNDKLLLGVDLIKPVEVVLPAYNDASGITAEFNLNLLDRINKELAGDFDRNKFVHKPEYTDEEGIAKSYLMSTEEQTVKVMGENYVFQKGEKIHTEISRKYSDDIVSKILEDTDFNILSKLTDSKGYFRNYIFNRA
jgi:L-histidine N-alpha-methyltransferase